MPVKIRSYASVPLPRSAHRTLSSGAPWLACDPQFQGECSAAVRAFRLACFAMFALFVAPFRARAFSADEPVQNPAIPQQALTADASAASSAWRAGSAQLLLWRDFSASFHAAQSGLSQRAVDAPKREALYLKIKRSHGPPVIDGHCALGLSAVSSARLNPALLPHYLSPYQKFFDRHAAARSGSLCAYPGTLASLPWFSRVELPAIPGSSASRLPKTNPFQGENRHDCC